MKRIIIFGIDGGIGNYIYNKLKQKKEYNVTGTTIQDVDATSLFDIGNFLNQKKEEKFDIVISTIGYMYIGNLLDTPKKELIKTFDVNVCGNFNILKATFPRINKNGKYIILGSISSEKVYSGMGSYSISKFGLSALLQTAVREFNKIKPIQIFMVNPNILERGSSAMTKLQYDEFKRISNTTDEEMDKRLLSQIPMKKFVTNRDIYNWIEFLISDKATFSCSRIKIDGGMSW